MARELTVKQRKLVQGIAAGKTKKQAAIDAGYSPKSAHQTAHETMKVPTVREAFLETMKKAGITDKRLVEVMKDGLGASRTVSAVTGKDANAGTVDFVDVPDHHARHKFLKTAVDIKGLEAAKQVNLRDQTLEDLLTLDDDDGGPTDTAESVG